MGDYLKDRMEKARKAELIRKGAKDDQADKILATQNKRRGETGRIVFVGGVVMLAVGLAATVGSYLYAAANGGGMYVIAGGLIVSGAAGVVRGRALMRGLDA